MYKIVFATNNQHKLEEIRSILGEDFEVLSLSDIGCHEDIPETSDTLEGNAIQKAQYVFDKYDYACFADDTGLEVEALGGEPGIYSARYAALDGDDSISHDSEANMAKLLRKLEGIENRKARFRTVIALITTKDNSPSLIGRDGVGLLLFEGIVNGSIIKERRGGEGFGYDPIFQPEGYDKTFAELGNEVKNHISHRARAVQKLADYLKSY
jgi:XTP/dITP diphosphohydrolase